MLFSPCRRRFEGTSSVFISFKCHKGRNGFFFLRFTNWRVLRYQTSQSYCCARSHHVKDLRIDGMSIRSLPALGFWAVKPQGKSLVVIPRCVDNGCMIEIHVRCHRRYSSEIVKLRAITKARQMQKKRKRGKMQKKRKRGK